MNFNKRVILTLMVFVVMIALAAARCVMTRPKPLITETHVVDDGDGHSHTVTNQYYDSTAGKALSTKTYPLMLAVSAVLFTMAGNFKRRVNRLNAMKNRCTVPVPAVVIAVDRSLHDDYIRYKGPVYNATYRYEYLGTIYEGNNRCYGLKRKAFTGKIKVGDSEEIFVNSQDPHDFFDILGADALRSAVYDVILCIATGFGSFLVLMLH